MDQLGKMGIPEIMVSRAKGKLTLRPHSLDNSFDRYSLAAERKTASRAIANEAQITLKAIPLPFVIAPRSFPRSFGGRISMGRFSPTTGLEPSMLALDPWVGNPPPPAKGDSFLVENLSNWPSFGMLAISTHEEISRLQPAMLSMVFWVLSYWEYAF